MYASTGLNKRAHPEDYRCVLMRGGTEECCLQRAFASSCASEFVFGKQHPRCRAYKSVHYTRLMLRDRWEDTASLEQAEAELTRLVAEVAAVGPADGCGRRAAAVGPTAVTAS